MQRALSLVWGESAGWFAWGRGLRWAVCWRHLGLGCRPTRQEAVGGASGAQDGGNGWSTFLTIFFLLPCRNFHVCSSFQRGGIPAIIFVKEDCGSYPGESRVVPWSLSALTVLAHSLCVRVNTRVCVQHCFFRLLYDQPPPPLLPLPPMFLPL